MELLLNLLWSAIAGSALAVYLRTAAAEGRQFLLGLGALLCLLTLLLPAISITEDLHFVALAVEDSSTTKRLANPATHASAISHVVWLGVSLLAMLFAALRGFTWRSAEKSFRPCADPQFSRPVFGRAPPAVLA
jgi:hypothetical protein